MNSVILILLFLLGIFITGGVPLIAYLYSKRKWGGTRKSFQYGILAFVISQLVLRIPLMNYVSTHFARYQLFSMNVIPFSIFTAFTAGLFEETARFLCFRFFLKEKRRNVDGIIFGFGHGGIEAFYLIGSKYLYLLIGLILSRTIGIQNIPNGLIHHRLISTLQMLEVTPANFLPGMLFPGIWERITAMTMQIGMTMIVLAGFQKQKPFRYYLLAILVHTLVDASLGIVPLFVASPLPILFTYFTLVAVLLTVYVIIHCNKVCL